MSSIGLNIDLFDLRVTRPLKLEEVKLSVKRTGGICAVDTGYKTLGIGSEIISQVTESCFKELKFPPVRIGLPDHPTPSSRGYIPGLYPDAEKIVRSICNSLSLPDTKTKLAIIFLKNKSNDLPIDIPDPSFQGPF